MDEYKPDLVKLPNEMNHNNKIDPNAFANYLQSMVNLNALEKISTDLDDELAKSQKIMKEIANMFNSVPTLQASRHEQLNRDLRHEDLSNFLEANVPKLLMPDMIENTIELDIDGIIATMKGYTEDLKKNYVLMHLHPREYYKTIIDHLDLEQYASSLDQLGKRLANLKLNKRDEVQKRNIELEAKLTQLRDDVNMFTQIFQSITALSQSTENWSKVQGQNSNVNLMLTNHYDNITNKLLSGINEVTYLLQNKN